MVFTIADVLEQNVHSDSEQMVVWLKFNKETHANNMLA